MAGKKGNSLLETRRRNRVLIKNMIFRMENARRTAIAEELGLTLPTITTSVNEMLSEGILEEIPITDGKLVNNMGRRPNAIAFRAEAAYAIGVELGPYATRAVLMNMVTDSADSILAAISGILVPIFRPLGMGDWRICTSLISGFIAKESVVSTLEVLFGGSIGTMISSLTAASILVFSLLYTPCVAAVASIKRELGAKWAVGVVIWQCVIAWIAALIVHLIGLFVGIV